MRVVVNISANAEWRAVRALIAPSLVEDTPFGECFWMDYPDHAVVFLHGGWGKIAAAASTQYAITRWTPDLLVNLGTCGGLAGQVERGEVLLVERTLVYDIIEQMGDAQEALNHYSVDLDLSWLPVVLPQPVRRGLLVSADRDICLEDVPMLREQYQAIAADWESGAIAWVAARNHTRCLILRGVSDLVDAGGGEAYQDPQFFRDAAHQVMAGLLESLPAWLSGIDI